MQSLKQFITDYCKVRHMPGNVPYGLGTPMFYAYDASPVQSYNFNRNQCSVYGVFKQIKEIGFKTIYAVIDFNAHLDMENDFLCLVVYEHGILTLSAYPYNDTSDEYLEEITKSAALTKIESNILEELNS